MRHPFLLLYITCACLLMAGTARANNIQVTNLTLTGNTGTSALVQFDLSWENSWRGGGVGNWDAAWVFVKYRPNGGGWQHVLLSNTGHAAPIGSIMDMGLLIPGGGTPYDPTANPVVGTSYAAARMATEHSPSPVCNFAGTMERRVLPTMTLPRCRSSPSR